MNQQKIQGLRPAAIVVKPSSTAKADLEVMSKQIAQLTTLACKNNIEILDIIVTFNNAKDISKRVKSLNEHTEIKYLMVYSAKTIATSEKEFMDFVNEMDSWYGIDVKRIK